MSWKETFLGVLLGIGITLIISGLTEKDCVCPCPKVQCENGVCRIEK